jgi:hypothetical protein
MHTLLLAAFIGCQALDLGTTYAALHSGRFVEGNPMLRPPQGYVVKIGVNVGALIWRKQHPVLIPATLAVSGCAAGVLNLHTMARAK